MTDCPADVQAWCARRPDGTLAPHLAGEEVPVIWLRICREVGCATKGGAMMKGWDVVPVTIGHHLR